MPTAALANSFFEIVKAIQVFKLLHTSDEWSKLLDPDELSQCFLLHKKHRKTSYTGLLWCSRQRRDLEQSAVHQEHVAGQLEHRAHQLTAQEATHRVGCSTAICTMLCLQGQLLVL